jgi:hypothetical protein
MNPYPGRDKKAIFAKDVEEVINQNYQLSEVTALSSQKGNVLLPLQMYYQEVASNFPTYRTDSYQPPNYYYYYYSIVLSV